LRQEKVVIDDLRKCATPYTIAAAVVISLTTFGGYLLGNALSFFPTTSRGPAEWIAGIAIGSLWGHATLAAAWTVFGPLPLVQRLPIALAWCAALCLLALGVSGEAGLALASGVAIAIQWVTVQIVFWPVAAALSLRIDRPGEPDIDAGAYRQFRIGQLLAPWGGMRIRQPGDDREVKVLPPPKFGRPQFGPRQLVVFAAAYKGKHHQMSRCKSFCDNPFCSFRAKTEGCWRRVEALQTVEDTSTLGGP
jgi:hypothetical protein